MAAEIGVTSTLEPGDSNFGRRTLRGPSAAGATVVAVAMSAFHLYTAGSEVFTAMVQRSVHLAFALTLIFVLFPQRRAARAHVPLVDWVLVALAVSSCLYITVNWEALSEAMRIAQPTRLDVGLGMVAVALVLEATRRTAGPALPLVSVAFIVYAFVGPYLPGLLNHPGVSVGRFIGMNYLFTEGIFGVPLGVSATFVIIFIIFGAFLEQSGGGRFFIDLASARFGAVRGGPAKIAIFGSGFFGSISGSAVANVVGTGAFTIPLMKRLGYRPHFAAAVEGVASTGGMLMPPVMGAAAFVMAEMLQVSYLAVCAAAAVPAILYFLSLFLFVDLEAAKSGLRGIPKQERPELGKVLRDGGHLLVAPAVLVYLLAVVQWSAVRAGFFAIVALVVTAMLRKHTRLTGAGFVAALRKGAVNALQVAAVCACAGIVISIVSITGLGLTFSTILTELAQGELFSLLVLTMLASLVLGMGLPATPCYIILAVLAAPALVQFNVSPMAAHLFVYYFGCISAITPPVALAAYAGAAIASASPMQSGFAAMRLGLPAFIIPFMFIYAPPLIMIGTPFEIALATVTSLLSVIVLVAAIQGFSLTSFSAIERGLLFAAALLSVKPGGLTDLAGLVMAAAVATRHVAKYLKERAARRASEAVIDEAGVMPR